MKMATEINRAHRSSIRRSKPEDLAAIRSWLEEEDRQGIPGNFLCNWSAIERAHQKGKLLVYIDGKTRLPIAFQLGGLIRPGILQVRHTYRGKGIGQKIVKHCIALASKNDQCLLYIECNPPTSIPFWLHMGFKLIDDQSEAKYAFKIVEKHLRLPEQGVNVSVVIRFFPESRNWEDETKPFATFSPQAKQAPDGTIYLAQRVQFHEEIFPDAQDVVVEIEVDGCSRYCDKAKYRDTREIGVVRCINGYYIDKISPALSEMP